MKAEGDNLLMFDEQTPPGPFRSECPPDVKIKVENLFRFRRGRGDLHFSLIMLGIALFFLLFFRTETGWLDRKLPEPFGPYLAHQLGLIELEGRVARFGRILKQSWVAPALCLLVLVPAAIWNARASWRVYKWRRRFKQPTDAGYDLEKCAEAIEFVAYFIVYTLAVPVVGYLLATLVLGTYLTWRLGYRSARWLATGMVSSFAIVLVFRTFLQIKTPVSIWLYDQLPAAARAFMLTYF